MNRKYRKTVIAGNWKMNKTPAEAKELLEGILPLVKDADCDVVACVPFVDLSVALETTAGSNVKIGAENCHWEASGAYTGEISAPMLAAMEVPYVIIGHSERRTYFGETDVTVNKRVKAALANGLTVILCVGEYLEQREQGVTGEVVAMQTKIDLQGVSAEELKRVIIAYEPVWAIGTGKTATAEQANEVCAVIRRGAAGSARRRRRPHRRRFPEARGLRRDREGGLPLNRGQPSQESMMCTKGASSPVLDGRSLFL